MTYENIRISSEEALTTITLDREGKLNSIDEIMLSSLEGAIAEIEGNSACRAVIITGTGNRSFCAGADINYLSRLKTGSDAERFADHIHGVFNRIEKLEKPVIAAINGYCLGGGCELAMACDIRISSPNAIFGQPEVRLGIVPGGGGTYRLPTLIGKGRATELILTGDTIDANTALSYGLINRIVDQKSLMDSAKSIALKLSGNSSNALKNAKLAINSNYSHSDDAEKRAFLACIKHSDAKEGLHAFKAHSEPKFK
jgi:enoyl-CoA hydratase